MKKYALFLPLFFTCLLGDISLKGKEKTINLEVNTVDTKAILETVNKTISTINSKELKNASSDILNHKERIELAQKNIKQLAAFRGELEINFIDIKNMRNDLEKAVTLYDKEIDKVYKNNEHIDRDAYILVGFKDGVPYENVLENYLVEKLAIKKYDQTTTLKKSLASTQMQSVIKTEKDFGQKTVDTAYEYIIRADNTIFKVVKITQNPFKKSSKELKNIENSAEALYQNNDIYIQDMELVDFESIGFELSKKLQVSMQSLEPFLLALKTKVDINKNKIEFAKKTKDVSTVLQKLDKIHNEQALKVINLQNKLDAKIERQKIVETSLDELLVQTQELLSPYKIPLSKETIGNITLLEPKNYTESVYLGEEKDFINRKIKGFVSNLNVTDLEQSETLIDFSDLSSTTKKKHKTVRFETLHFLPYLAPNNKLGLFTFASISLKDESNEADIVTFNFKYGKMKFVPIKRGYKTLFVSQNELTIGIVKEFLETNSVKKYFDQYCIDNSFLPESAKDFKNAKDENLEYPAVCFKVDAMNDFMTWLSNKTNREMVIPTVDDWAYVASNGDTTNFCWGNQTPGELEDEELLPENIYLKTHKDQAIMKVQQFPKSKSGIYDMCGNVFELTVEDNDLKYKGNSFSSYIENSRDKASRYSDDINQNLGLRPFYIKDVTNE